jgi:hypothetical protein
MGVERAVIRWYLQRQIILNEIAQLEAQGLASQEVVHQSHDTAGKSGSDLLAKAQERLDTLGPCPKQMMG